MSRQNKVNPGMYTQRGRLTQDDAARELAKQRSIGSEHTWQPVQRDAQPRLKSKSGGGDAVAVDEKDAPADEKPVSVTARKKPAGAAVKAKPAQKTAPRTTAKTRARTTARGKARTASPRKVKATGARTIKAKAKSAKSAKSAKRRKS